MNCLNKSKKKQFVMKQFACPSTVLRNLDRGWGVTGGFKSGRITMEAAELTRTAVLLFQQQHTADVFLPRPRRIINIHIFFHSNL